MNLSGASRPDCATHDSQCFRSEQKVPGERTGCGCRSNRSLGLARLIRVIRARQSRRQRVRKGNRSLCRGRGYRLYSPFDRGPILYIWYKGKAAFNERL